MLQTVKPSLLMAIRSAATKLAAFAALSALLAACAMPQARTVNTPYDPYTGQPTGSVAYPSRGYTEAQVAPATAPAAAPLAIERAGSPIDRFGNVSVSPVEDLAPDYLIGPYDQLQIFVWRAEELSIDVTVRPDGRISTPLVEDMVAAGKTPSQLSRDLEIALAEYVKAPEVTVIVGQFSSTFSQQVRVLGETPKPSALPYQTGMTVLDVMLGVGGLTEFAAGNRAKLIRGRGASQQTYRVRLDDLMRRGDVSANAPVRPGDVILIPESRF